MDTPKYVAMVTHMFIPLYTRTAQITSTVLRKSFVLYSTTSLEGLARDNSWIVSAARVSIFPMSCTITQTQHNR